MCSLDSDGRIVSAMSSVKQKKLVILSWVFILERGIQLYPLIYIVLQVKFIADDFVFVSGFASFV
jgi:hypothetical protein